MYVCCVLRVIVMRSRTNKSTDHHCASLSANKFHIVRRLSCERRFSPVADNDCVISQICFFTCLLSPKHCYVREENRNWYVGFTSTGKNWEGHKHNNNGGKCGDLLIYFALQVAERRDRKGFSSPAVFRQSNYNSKDCRHDVSVNQFGFSGSKYEDSRDVKGSFRWNRFPLHKKTDFLSLWEEIRPLSPVVRVGWVRHNLLRSWWWW